MRQLFFGTTVVILIGLGSLAHADATSPPHTGQSASELRANANLLLILNQDQFAGTWQQFKGDLKQRWGKFTDDDLLYIEGRYDKYEGKLQERYGDRKEEIKQWTDD